MIPARAPKQCVTKPLLPTADCLGNGCNVPNPLPNSQGPKSSSPVSNHVWSCLVPGNQAPFWKRPPVQVVMEMSVLAYDVSPSPCELNRYEDHFVCFSWPLGPKPDT